MAVALREELRQRFPDIECLFVGTPQGLEARVLPGLDFPLRTIKIGGLVKSGWKRAAKTTLQLPVSLVASWRILGECSPGIVVGLGGYSSGPVVAAARLRGLPSVIIEPNVVPGLTNRWLARWAQGAAVAFAETARHLKCPCRVTGIPIRAEFHRIRAGRIDVKRPLRLLVFGGSQGSRPINRLVCAALPHLAAKQIEVVHQTGEADLKTVGDCYRGHEVKAGVFPYIEDMPGRFAWADLVLCRAGASTIAEITAAGRPSILIPFPQAADDHQRHNAEMLESKGAAKLLEQSKASGESLAAQIGELEGDREQLRRMGAAARKLARPGSAAAIVDYLLEIGGNGP